MAALPVRPHALPRNVVPPSYCCQQCWTEGRAQPVATKRSGKKQPEVPLRRAEPHTATIRIRSSVACAALREPVKESSGWNGNADGLQERERDANPGVQRSLGRGGASRRPAESLADGSWVKLICGASFEVHLLAFQGLPCNSSEIRRTYYVC